MASTPGFKPGPHWWETSALTTAPPLLQYIHCLQVAIRHLKEVHEVIPILRSLLTNNPPRQGKVGHTRGVYVPYSFRTVVWVLLSPTITSSAVRRVLWFFVLIREYPRHPDLGSDKSSEWNFCACFSDAISRGN